MRKCESVGFFFSLTTDINRVSPNSLVPATEQHKPGKYNDPGVRIHKFLPLAVNQFLFVSRQWLLRTKVTIGKCGSSSEYKSNFE